MANEEHLAILRQGVEAWNEWRERNPDERPDLSGANLKRAELIGANLNFVDLTEANLAEANLTGSYFIGARLSRAILTDADLNAAHLAWADLSESDLTGATLIADLTGARFYGTNLSGASLAGADLRGAHLRGAKTIETIFSYTIFGDVDLSEVAGLELARHLGPSIIGIDTIYKSKGKIPAVFLRGAGVPENFITYFRSLVVRPIQYQSCFISYSTKDEDFARRLYSRMRDEQLRVWFAPEDVQGGKKLHEQIERAIQVHDRLLLVLSENSIRSEWVITEVRRARKAEVKENRRKLFSIRLVDFETLRDWECFDADTGKDLALEVRGYFIPDFSNWKDHDKFETAFARLLHDLKAEDTSPVAQTEA